MRSITYLTEEEGRRLAEEYLKEVEEEATKKAQHEIAFMLLRNAHQEEED